MEYKVTNKLEDFDRAEIVALDFETIGLIDKTPELFSLARRENNEILGGSFGPEQIHHLLRFLKGKRVVCHNFKFDGQVLMKLGFDIFSFKTDCTAIMASILDETVGHGLKERTEVDLGWKLTKWEEVNKSDKDLYAKYATEDAVATIALYYPYRDEIVNQKLKLAYLIEMKAVYPIMCMEYGGIGFDIDKLETLRVLCNKEKIKSEDGVFQDAGRVFGLTKTGALAEYIYEDLEIDLKKEYKTQKGARSVAAGVIEQILEDLDEDDERREHIFNIVRWKRLNKLSNSFFDPLKNSYDEHGDGRVHPNINNLSIVTGRLSMSGPNLHQLPADPILLDKDDKGNFTRMDTHIRSAFIAPPGKVLIGADYSQIELRMLAHWSTEPAMIKAYVNGVDYHQMTVDETGGKISRQQAKIANFAKLYGMEIYGFAKIAKISMSESKEFYRAYDIMFPLVKELKEGIVLEVLQRGYIRMLGGRKRRNQNETDPRLIERYFMSGRIQGSAAIIMKLGMINCFDRYRDRDVKIVLTVHDELVFECPEEMAEEVCINVKQDMELGCLNLKVPLLVKPKIAKNFAEVK